MLLLISTTFPYLCHCRLSDAEAYHADGNCHTNECNSDTAQSLLPDVHGLSVRSDRSALAHLPGGGLRVAMLYPTGPLEITHGQKPRVWDGLTGSIPVTERQPVFTF